MQVYFSHSYRDVAVNSYFLDHFVSEEIPLQADQKTDIWCVAKLERYLGETTGFVSIIPRRPTESDSAAYSPYIGQELALARRARVPRLLFVDEDVLISHSLDFPEDAVAFRTGDLESRSAVHGRAITLFRQQLEAAFPRVVNVRPKAASVIAGDGAMLREAAQDVAEVLTRSGFGVTLLSGRRPGRGLEDIRLLEALRTAELCAFVLGTRLSDAHIALAMAHADFIPSLRLQYDPTATDSSPSLSGVIRWRNIETMLVEVGRQLAGYTEGLVQPVDLALASTATNAARLIGTMRWHVRDDNLWDTGDGASLVLHVRPDHSFIRDEVSRARAQIGRALGTMRGREGTFEVCSALYDGLLRHRFGYEIEAATSVAGAQAIRTPTQIAAHRTATCLDLACLFAALLEAAGHNPLLVVLQGDDFAHALVGYRVTGEPAWNNSSIGDLRGALARRDAVLFEATGAAESDEPIGSETKEARSDRLLSFMDAIDGARRMIYRADVRLRYFIDVRASRSG